MVLFAVEMGMKVIVYGFVLNEGSYLRSGWNWLDMTIVAIGIAIETAPTSSSKDIRFLRVLRTFRALRPLRMISWNPGMRVVVNAIFQAIPALADVLVVCVMTYFIFVSSSDLGYRQACPWSHSRILPLSMQGASEVEQGMPFLAAAGRPPCDPCVPCH